MNNILRKFYSRAKESIVVAASIGCIAMLSIAIYLAISGGYFIATPLGYGAIVGVGIFIVGMFLSRAELEPTG